MLLGLAGAWLVALLLAPVVAAGRVRVDPPGPQLTRLTYLTGGLVCHRRPERSFTVAGVAMPVCGRCFGLYLAAPAGLCAALAGAPGGTFGQLRRRWLAAAAPTAVTLLVEWAGAEVSNVHRAAAAVPLGLMTAWITGAVVHGRMPSE